MSIIGKIFYGLQVAAIGLVVVFVGLGILIGTVYLMGYGMEKVRAQRRAARAKAAEAAEMAANATVAAPPIVAPDAPVVEDVTDDAELIAVIAAAIAAFDNSGKSLVVRRVRRVTGWNRAARAEQVCRF